MQQESISDLKNNLNGSGSVAKKASKAIQTLDQDTSLTETFSSAASSLGIDLDKWTEVVVDRYDVWSGAAVSYGKSAVSFARRHPVYTALGVFAVGYVLRKYVRSARNK